MYNDGLVLSAEKKQRLSPSYPGIASYSKNGDEIQTIVDKTEEDCKKKLLKYTIKMKIQEILLLIILYFIVKKLNMRFRHFFLINLLEDWSFSRINNYFSFLLFIY